MKKTKKITIFIDTEGYWEGPYRRYFDNEKVLLSIKKVLDKYEAKAVFNVLGKVAEKHPDAISKLHNSGHEIASHGYSHENFVQLNKVKLNAVLEKTDKIIYSITGKKSSGIRAPWLLANKESYELFRKRGYLWSSNKRRLHVEQIYNPTSSYRGFFERFAAKTFIRVKSWAYSNKPFKLQGVTEIPLYSSMDGELLGLIDPEQESPKLWMDYTYKSWISQFNSSGEYFNLNLHDWLIGTSNRIKLLDSILNDISKKKNIKFFLARDIVKRK
jgi:peptidoglycan/xylan/chitin deacetylase (PgdA/CDA1 family)